jgi:hypothetical protein
LIIGAREFASAMVWAGRVPARHVGQARVADLARADEVVERPHDLFDRGQPVPRVQQEEVDVVGAQPAQRRLDGADHVLAPVAALVEVPAEDRADLVLGLPVGGVEPGGAEVHRAEGEPADAQPGTPEEVVLVECHGESAPV